VLFAELFPSRRDRFAPPFGKPQTAQPFQRNYDVSVDAHFRDEPCSFRNGSAEFFSEYNVALRTELYQVRYQSFKILTILKAEDIRWTSNSYLTYMFISL